MSLIPSTVASGGTLPDDLYFALKTDIAPAQTLSLTGNSLALSGGGGAVNVAAATSVALSTQKLTNTTYDSLLDKTSTAGQTIVLEPALAVRIQPKLEVESELSVQSIGGKVTIINGIDGIYTTGNLQTLAEIKDSFGNPGAAGQQLQSSGPGLPWVWGAGAGVGVTAVVAGTNIGVDNTNPIAPVVNVAISSTLDMSGQEIINASDITVKGAVPGINFKDTAGADQGDLTYIELTDILRLQSSKVLINTNNTRDYIIAMNEGGSNQFEISAKDKPIRIIRNDSTGLAPDTELTFEAAGKVKLTSAVSDPVTLRLENAGGKYGEIVASETNGTLSVKAQAGYGLELESTAGITMKPATGIVEIVGDETIGSPPTLKFTDSGLPRSIDMTMRTDGFGFGTGEIASTAGFFSVSTGAVEGVAIGTNGLENLIMGYGLPLKISNSIGTLPLQYIELQNANNISLYTADSLALDKTASVNIDPANSIQLTINDVPSGLGTTMTMSATGSIFDSGAAGTDTVFQVLQNGGTAEFNISAAGGSYTCLLSAENGIDLLAANGQIRGNNAEGTWNMYKPAYGQFSSSVTQNASAGGTKLLFNTTVISQDIAIGVTTSRITPAYPGIYKIAYSIQLDKAGAGAATGSIWIARSNSNQSNTNRRIRLAGSDSLPLSSDFLISITAGQYVEVVLQSTDTTVTALAVAAALPIPATPSIIFTMERVA